MSLEYFELPCYYYASPKIDLFSLVKVVKFLINYYYARYTYPIVNIMREKNSERPNRIASHGGRTLFFFTSFSCVIFVTVGTQAGLRYFINALFTKLSANLK